MNSYSLSIPADENYRAEHRNATRQLLIDEITRPRFNRRLAFPVAAGMGVILVGTGTAVAYQLASSAPVTDKHTARCYSVVSTDFGKDFPGVTVAAVRNSRTDAPAVVAAPVDLCRYFWSSGNLHPASTPKDTTSRSGRSANEVPPLIGCVLPDGTAGVFPGTEQTCQDLGLPVAQPG